MQKTPKNITRDKKERDERRNGLITGILILLVGFSFLVYSLVVHLNNDYTKLSVYCPNGDIQKYTKQELNDSFIICNNTLLNPLHRPKIDFIYPNISFELDNTI